MVDSLGLSIVRMLNDSGIDGICSNFDDLKLSTHTPETSRGDRIVYEQAVPFDEEGIRALVDGGVLPILTEYMNTTRTIEYRVDGSDALLHLDLSPVGNLVKAATFPFEDPAFMDNFQTTNLNQGAPYRAILSKMIQIYKIAAAHTGSPT